MRWPLKRLWRFTTPSVADDSTSWRNQKPSRARRINKAITTDLATHDVTRETTGIEEFFRAVESLYQRVADLFRGREA
jgi:hypothetical protein